MSMRQHTLMDSYISPRASDLTDLPQEAWDDVQGTAVLAWDAWVSLFPTHGLWDPFGAALTLAMLVLTIAWLLKIRPG